MDNNESGHWWAFGIIKNGTKTEGFMVCQADWHAFMGSLGSSRFLNSPMSLLLLEQPLLFFLSHVIHLFLRQIGQNLIVAQIVVEQAGLLLCPSIYTSATTVEWLVPPVAMYTIQTLSRFGFILYLFLVGVKTDFGVLKRTGSKAVILGFSGFFLSAGLGLATLHAVSANLPESSIKTTPYLIILNSVTFFIATSQHLLDLEISNSELGHLASCMTLVLDASAMFMDTFVIKFILLEKRSYDRTSEVRAEPFLNLVSILAYYAFLFFGCRPLMILIIQRTPVGRRMKQSHLLLILVIFLATAFVAECINQPASPFLLGLSLPDTPFGPVLADKLEGIITGFFLPLLCATTGLSADFRMLSTKSLWLELVFLMCFVGKMVGTIVASMCFKLSFSDALALALIISAKGLVEIVTLLLWKDAQACILSLLEASKSTKYIPLSITALHLIKLTGRSMPFREPLHLVHKAIVRETISDHTLNAFQSMQKRNDGNFRVQHYVATAPHKTMYTDICSLAHEKGTSLIIVPFHKMWTIDGGKVESWSAPTREVNRQVLEEAPCSVGFLVDRTHVERAGWITSNEYMYNAVMLFIGGPDDREALLYCRLLANHPRVRLTMVWIKERYNDTENQFRLQSEDNEDDVKLLMDFQYHVKDNERVMLREEYVSDGMEATEVVFQLGAVDLVIIGRWHDHYSSVTSGLTNGGVSADLGTLGDMLAGPDFQFSVLVIQRQPMIAWIA